jgi:hypothetical protein
LLASILLFYPWRAQHDQLTDFSARLAGLNVGAPARFVPSGDFGLIGLAVMGQNLILNAADHGFTVVAYNRTVAKVDRFLENEAKGTEEKKKELKKARICF